MRRLISVVLAIAAMAVSMMAGDLKITFNAEAKAMLRTQKSTETNYYSSRYQLVRNEKEKTDKLTDYEGLVTYEIDHKKKTIQKVTMDDIAKMMELLSTFMEENKDAKDRLDKMLGGDADAAASVKRGGAEVVAGRTCNKWNVSIGKTIVSNFSVDPTLELPIPQTGEAIQLQNAMMMMIPGIGSALAKFAEENAKIKGVRLRTEMVMKMGPITIRATREAVKIEEGPIPASVFELPKGYKVEEPMKKEMEELKKKLEKAASKKK